MAVCRFTVAVTPRTKRRDTWEDGEATYYRCQVWRDPADNAGETITKGMRLLVHGRVKTRTFTDKNGVERLLIELDVDEVGPTLRYATAKVNKVSRSRGGRGTPAVAAPVYDDPYAGGPPTAADDEPPF
jgi:single-strand DNA-binding protein